MKKLIKRIIAFIERIFRFKTTRSLVVETTKALYVESENVKKALNQIVVQNDKLKRELDGLKKEQREVCKNQKNVIKEFLNNEYIIANDIWRRNGATEELESRLGYLFQSTLAWKECSHEIWLIYISILLEKNKMEKVETVWNKYMSIYPDKIQWLHRYLCVSKYAISKNILSENVLIAAKIYENFDVSRSDKKLEKLLLKAKSIAIVGNGPSERGLGKGVEIDNHQLVIRFNNFSTYGFEADYGKKTNVWVKCSNDDIKHERDIYGYEMIVYEADYMHHPLEYNYHTAINHEMEQNIDIDYLDFELHKELRELLGIFPSTGLLIVWLVAKLGILYKTDIYGFSFLQKKVDSYASHYFEDRSKEMAIKKSSHHSFNIESRFVRDLYEGKYEEKYLINDVMNNNIFVDFMDMKRPKEVIKEVKQVHSITHRPFAPNGGSGGGGAVLSCQKILLGDKYNDLECRYTFFETNKFTRLKPLCDLHDLWGAAYFAMENTQDEEDTVYITHDYGTAFGLYLLGKPYVYVCHLQGPRLEEKTNFGESYTENSGKIIRECEKLVVENAEYVCFPSKGAQEYFENSEYQNVAEYHAGPILYNTLYAYPEPEKVLNIEKQENVMTVLSVGQLTFAKGIDQCIEVFEKMVLTLSQSVRWIIVGKGPYKEKILSQCEELKNKYDTFSYIYIEKCKYEQMQYLQNISDVYLMLQRISIFDLTTLELMRKGKIIVLSNVGGNTEFNKENNVILHDGNYDITAKRIIQEYEEKRGPKNKEVYDRYFSNEQFVERYHILIDKLIEGVINE